MCPYGETFAGFYDRHFGNHAENSAPLLLRYFASLPAPLRQLPVLDLGCGTGRLAFHFLEAGFSFVGLDLSPSMLALAEDRCRHYLDGGARFGRADISSFQAEGPFGMAVSTYNALNHLDSRTRLRGCFRSVRRCLAPEGRFLFDFHTRTGLSQWVSRENADWGNDRVECLGEFDESKGMGIMRLKGTAGDVPFEEKIANYAFPLDEVGAWLGEEGFGSVGFFSPGDLFQPLREPEKESRVMVIAY